jgi:hypothetical protein
MKFNIAVGEIDKHLVEFSFNQLCGRLAIHVDDRPIYQSTRLFNEPVSEAYRFAIDGLEKLEVRIEQRRKPLFGHHNSVFVNDRLTKVFDRYF